MVKTVAIYGATAFSAGPAIEYLLSHPESADFRLVLAGRNRQKLEKVESNLAKGKDVEIAVLELGDEEAVKRFVESADVIINFAGMSSVTSAAISVRVTDFVQDLTVNTMEKLSSSRSQHYSRSDGGN